MKQSKIFKVLLSLVAVGGMALMAQSFTTAEPQATTASAPATRFVKTNYRCTKSNCSCSGYWGYKHNNGTYEGACSNTDGHGHTCGHGPEKHGLRKW